MWSTHYLLLAVLGAGYEIDGLHVSDINLVSKNVREDDLFRGGGTCASEDEYGGLLKQIKPWQRISSVARMSNWHLRVHRPGQLPDIG